jgi:hypothetical protein
MLRPIKFPDEIPSLPQQTDFTMAAGDFLELYATQSGKQTICSHES